MDYIQFAPNVINSQNHICSRNSINKQDFSSKLDATTKYNVLSELETYFGVKIDVKSIKKGDKNVIGYATSPGSSTIAIAPNIIKKMSTDSELKQKIIGSISKHIESIPYGRKYLAAHGIQLIATGTIVHEDGTITHWVIGDESPEEKERIRKQMEIEEKEKLARKQSLIESRENYLQKIRTYNMNDYHINLENTNENHAIRDYLDNCVIFSNYKTSLHTKEMIEK